MYWLLDGLPVEIHSTTDTHITFAYYTNPHLTHTVARRDTSGLWARSLTPPMVNNSWDAYGGDVIDTEVER